MIHEYPRSIHETDSLKRDFKGRSVLTLELADEWIFLPEEEFRERQQRTVDYLRRNDRVPPADR